MMTMILKRRNLCNLPSPEMAKKYAFFGRIMWRNCIIGCQMPMNSHSVGYEEPLCTKVVVAGTATERINHYPL